MKEKTLNGKYGWEMNLLSTASGQPQRKKRGKNVELA